MKIGVLSSHPIQNQAPLFRALASRCDLDVFFAHEPSAQAQADAGFDVPFAWDVDLLQGYGHRFLPNVARHPDVSRFTGCDTPGVVRLIRDGRFDAFMVSGWALKCYWQAVWACRAAGVPVLVRGDSQLASARKGWHAALRAVAYPAMLRCFDRHLYVGRRNREYLEHYGVPAARLVFSPHCVDVQRFASSAEQADREQLRADWGASPGTRVVLFSGKLMANKRPLDMIRACTRLLSGGSKLLAVIAGDGALRADIEALARESGVALRMLGFVNQSAMPGVYRAADVLALPSDSETWGLAVSEALACGTPVVVSDKVGCAPDLVHPGATGECFPVGDIDALSRAIARTASLPPDRQRMSALANEYSPEAAASGVLAAAASRLPGSRQSVP